MVETRSQPWAKHFPETGSMISEASSSQQPAASQQQPAEASSSQQQQQQPELRQRAAASSGAPDPRSCDLILHSVWAAAGVHCSTCGRHRRRGARMRQCLRCKAVVCTGCQGEPRECAAGRQPHSDSGGRGQVPVVQRFLNLGDKMLSPKFRNRNIVKFSFFKEKVEVMKTKLSKWWGCHGLSQRP